MSISNYYNTGIFLERFTVIGINHRLADVGTRSLFGMAQSETQALLEDAKESGLKSVIVLSTCNRSEIYAFTNDIPGLINLFVKHTRGNHEIFESKGFTKLGEAALDHLFSVAAGLDSRIVGDAEILGQLKTAISFSRKRKMIGPIMDRTLSFALQASKAVRTHTTLSAGSTSVSYAAIEWIRQQAIPSDSSVLLIGTGKFGNSVAKNIVEYFPAFNLTLLNRTDEKASAIAATLGLNWISHKDLSVAAGAADIVIVCTRATEYSLLPSMFAGNKQQWLLDLSVPSAIHPDVKNITTVRSTDIDAISELMTATVAARNGEIPRVLEIIEHFKAEYFAWINMQRHVPVINDMKGKLQLLGEIHWETDNQDALNQKVNRAVGSLAMNLRYRNEKGCHYIHAINEFLKPDSAHA
jgi:glutamyl-tRNA reductase